LTFVDGGNNIPASLIIKFEKTRRGIEIMSKDIMKIRNNEILTGSDMNDIEVIEPSRNANQFFSFQYSYREITSVGGKTHIKSKDKKFADGKFTSEEFEGTTDQSIYNSLFDNMQRNFFGQMLSLLKPFSLLLPLNADDKKR
jgi:hypothetical protein